MVDLGKYSTFYLDRKWPAFFSLLVSDIQAFYVAPLSFQKKSKSFKVFLKDPADSITFH